jgi:hypothetical protein
VSRPWSNTFQTRLGPRAQLKICGDPLKDVADRPNDPNSEIDG